MHKFLVDMFSFPLSIYLTMDLLDPIVILFNLVRKYHTVFHIGCPIPDRNVLGFQFVHIFSSLVMIIHCSFLFSFSFDCSHPSKYEVYLIVFLLICVSLMAEDFEHLFRCLLA